MGKIRYNNRKRKGENKMFDDFDLMETCEEYYEEEYTEEEEWAKAHFFFMREQDLLFSIY